MINYLSKQADWLRTLDQIEGADLPLVGGKAYRLAVLTQHHLNVPPGLILTTVFFETQLKYFHLTPLWAGSPDVEVTTEALSWLADTLKTKPIARELTLALNQKLTDVFGAEVNSFAVRSSAIDEDQQDHTFAGVHLTELGVPRSLLPVAISRCWASALSETAAKYRLRHGMSIQGIRMAVLIQPMLKPFVSGVGFTCNPLTGADNEIVVEAHWGLGEAVVSGKVQPYFYKLANQPPTYPILEQRVGSPPPPPATPTSPLLESDLIKLVGQLEQVQALMGGAQDVEWAKQDNTLFILQTRPVTKVLPPPVLTDQEWTQGNYPEFLPDLPSPLFSSMLERVQPHAAQFFEELKLEVAPFTPYTKTILGRPYINLSLLKKAVSQLGGYPNTILLPLVATDIGHITTPQLISNWGQLWRKRATGQALMQEVRNVREKLKRHEIFVDEAVNILEQTNIDQTTITDLQIQLRLHDRLYSEFFKINLRLTAGIVAMTAMGSYFIAPLTPHPAMVISTLATKLNPINSPRNLFRLANLARQDERVRYYLRTAAADYSDYERVLSGTAFYHEFDELLTLYSHQTTYEADPGWPRRYTESATMLLALIQQHIEMEQPLRETPANRTWSDLIGPIPIWQRWRCWLAQPAVTYLRKLLRWRDALHEINGRGMTACRRWDLNLGHKWTEYGWLTEPDDIFWLTLTEIEYTLLVENKTGLGLASTVQARKETYKSYAELNMPFTMWESALPNLQFGGEGNLLETVDVIVGLPISPGQARGTVLVIEDPRDFRQIASDIILVTPSTSPTWLPLLNLSVGLIVEVGGLLSHGSVIAREYGLPGVANIPYATKRFKTGDIVLVDGSTGIIQILEHAPEE